MIDDVEERMGEGREGQEERKVWCVGREVSVLESADPELKKLCAKTRRP